MRCRITHDMREIYWGRDSNSIPENPHLRIKVSVDPLSAIIALADLLEDFQRPATLFTRNEPDQVTVVYSHACEFTELDWNDNLTTLRIVFGERDSASFAQKLPFLSSDMREYFDKSYGYMDFSEFGVSRVEMEARIA